MCKDIYVKPLPILRSCDIESLGVTITLQSTKLQVFNICHSILGDFNAHSPTWNLATLFTHRSYRSGTYISYLLQNFPHFSTRHMSIHLRGGVLDLSFMSIISTYKLVSASIFNLKSFCINHLAGLTMAPPRSL